MSTAVLTDTLGADQALRPGESLTSRSGEYSFYHQTDGNLVLYRNADNVALWNSHTFVPNGVLAMQGDGNLVLYSASDEVLWTSGTFGRDGSRFVVQDDSNLVIYTPGDRPVWDIGLGVVRGPSAHGDTIRPGEVLRPGGSLLSPSGRYSFYHQTDGNLVLYRNADSAALWNSGTTARDGVLVLQPDDGNLVLYSGDRTAAWASSVIGAGNRVVLQEDGELVVQRADGSIRSIAPLHRASVVLLGFRCLRQSWDDALRRDGAGDEIYLKASVAELDSSGEPRRTARSISTPVHGQGRLFFPGVGTVPIPGRIEVGGESPFGGIRSGDRWPWPDPTAPALPITPPSPTGIGTLPVLAWEWSGPAGALSGSLLVSPSVWEHDNGRPLDTAWGDAEAKTIADVAQRAAAAGGALTAVFPALAPLATVGAALVAAAQLGPTVLRAAKDVLGEPGDRPIGQTKQPDGTRTYDPPVLAVDLTNIPTAARTDTGFGPGIWRAVVRDSANLGGGEYEIYLRLSYE